AFRAALAGASTPLNDNPALPQFGAAASQVLQAAQGFLGELAVDTSLTTEQVLLALLHGDESLRGRLENHGMSWEQLQRATAAAPIRVEESLRVDESLRLGDVTERFDT